MYHYQSTRVRILDLTPFYCCYSSINIQGGCSNVLRKLKAESQWKDSNPQILSYCQLPKFRPPFFTFLYLFKFDFIVLKRAVVISLSKYHKKRSPEYFCYSPEYITRIQILLISRFANVFMV